jgi:hypothetical protein
MVPLGSVKRLTKYMKFAFAFLLERRTSTNLPHCMARMSAFVTNAVAQVQAKRRHLKNGETNIGLSCYPSHALGDNRPQ